MKQITDLPIYDLWPIIFRNLSIYDLFNCRLVSKKFKEFSDRGINKLVIGEPCVFDYNYWIYNNKFIEDKEKVSVKCFRSIQSLSIFNLDKNLKYLKICDSQFELEELSNLNNLEYLEIGHHYNINSSNNDKNIINSNSLKVFVNYNLSVELNTPKLEKIKSDNIEEIKLNSNPDSIKHLITLKYVDEFQIFKNLEIMQLNQSTNTVNENLLIIFKNLKQLKVNGSNYLDERIKNSLINILNDKMRLKRQIDIYLEDIKIENIDKFNQIRLELSGSKWKLRLDNYDSLDLNLTYIDQLIFNHLEECVNNLKNDLPLSFFDKFSYLKYVSVGDDVKDVDSLNWLLNNLQCLLRLRINSDVSFGQVFYNNLPNTIRWLEIYSREDINYDFILKLSKFIVFTADVDKDLIDLALTAFLNLKYLEFFGFIYKNRLITIGKRYNEFILNGNEKISDYNQLKEKFNLIKFDLNSDQNE